MFKRLLSVEFKSSADRGWGLFFGLVIGGLIGFVVGGVSSSWAVVAGAKWWEVMTAFGTVGAVVVALWFSVLSSFDKRKNKIDRMNAAAASLGISLSAISHNLRNVLSVIDGKKPVNHLSKQWLTRLWTIESIQNEDLINIREVYKYSHSIIHFREELVWYLMIGRVPKEYEENYDYSRAYMALRQVEMKSTLTRMADHFETVGKLAWDYHTQD